MRIPAAIAAASLTLAPATPVEQLLDSVSETHTTSITAINSAETDDEVRDVLVQWRKELITAADELADLREEAAADGLTEQEKASFDEAEATIKRERAGVRELRAELLPEDTPVVVPAPIEELGGILGTTAFDAYERSEDGDAPIVFGIPGVGGAPATTPTTKPTVVKEPTASTAAPSFGPEVTHRVERLQDETTTSTTTETSSATTTTSTSTSTTSSGTTTESATSTTTQASSTTTATSSSTTSVMENRTTSATSSTTRSSSTTTSSSTTRSTTSSTTTTEDDDERDGDLAETGTPMRALITIGVLSLLVGAALVLTGAARPRGARK